ncbi:MAG: amidophosphoribosyltransferase [Candidatus Brockarchaeota archaeon]|nr:amidophosphoribosyltransferase [Candidatus Brockarchaeota archaeon]
MKAKLGSVSEGCGVIGLRTRSGNAAHLINQGLYALQHRGQESCGMFVHDGKELKGHKAIGMVAETFDDRILTRLSGKAGIGHVRYSTTPGTSILEAQPFLCKMDGKSFALAFNGTISNFVEKRRALKSSGYRFSTRTDTEVLAFSIAEAYGETGDYFEALGRCMDALDGSFSLVLITENGELYGAKDRLGFKPLCIGSDETRGLYVVASESAAVDVLGAQTIGEVKPGEVVKLSKGGVERRVERVSRRHAMCMFEYVYFARPDSVINGICVYDARYRLGRNLAKSWPMEADMVIPVPDSGRTAASGYAQELGLPLIEGLMKNRYVWRTFIMPRQEVRDLSVRLKLNPVKSAIKGKEIVLVDDTIVRGTTMRRIVRLLRSGGAKRVYVGISCPPVVSSCYMGIDFPTGRELIASRKSVEEIRRYVRADRLAYQTLEGLVDGIGVPKSELCLACLTGEYPLEKTADLSSLEKELARK